MSVLVLSMQKHRSHVFSIDILKIDIDHKFADRPFKITVQMHTVHALITINLINEHVASHVPTFERKMVAHNRDKIFDNQIDLNLDMKVFAKKLFVLV